MSALGRLIAAEYRDWEGPRFVEEEIFGTGDPDRIAGRVAEFCSHRLGSPIASYEFLATSVMSVHGVRLVDGRRVVVKVARRGVGASFLSAVHALQAHLGSRGFPCPKPVLGPTALEAGIAVVEELLDAGIRGDAHYPRIRGAIASGLARTVDLGRGFGALPGLRPSLLSSAAAGELWPTPHDRRFDFPRTAAGAEWIDELAATARTRLTGGSGETVVAHSDWRAEHLRLEDDQIVATYDWQSLAVGREPALVGAVAHAFTADWGIAQPRRLPTLEQARAFIADYEAARGAGFSKAERDTVGAAWVYATAYGARCEHSDAHLGFPWSETEVTDDSYRGLLARHGDELLARGDRLR